ncbi:MAG: DUF805 domain-containing protein [Pseudomonadota bacterium]
MDFREAIHACFQDYFKFSGRARRPEFWWFVLFLMMGSLFLAVIDQILFGKDRIMGLGGLFSLFTLFPGLAVSWRRLHDVGRPGWMNIAHLPFFLVGVAIAPVMPLGTVIMFLLSLGIIGVVIFWAVSRSDQGPNEYGPEPPVGRPL